MNTFLVFLAMTCASSDRNNLPICYREEDAAKQIFVNMSDVSALLPFEYKRGLDNGVHSNTNIGCKIILKSGGRFYRETACSTIKEIK